MTLNPDFFWFSVVNVLHTFPVIKFRLFFMISNSFHPEGMPVAL